MDETLVQRVTVEELSPEIKAPQAQPPARKKSRRIAFTVFFLLVLVALGLMVVHGIMARSAWTSTLQQQTNEVVAALTVDRKSVV